MGEGCEAGKNFYCHGDGEVNKRAFGKARTRLIIKVPFEQALLFCIHL
jgi:hypothetical protein